MKTTTDGAASPTSPDALRDLAVQFLADLQHINSHTYRSYAHSIERLLDLAIPLDNDILTNYERASTQKDGLSPRSALVRLAAVRRFLTWLDANDLLPGDCNRTKIVAKLLVRHGRDRASRQYHRRQIDPRLPELRDYFDKLPLPTTNSQLRLELLRNRALVQCLFASGARIAEIASITCQQVNGAHREDLLITGKGGKQRIIWLDQRALSSIRTYLAERTDKYPALFVSYRQGLGKCLTTGALCMIVKRAAAALHLYPNTSPHSIRHYVATDMLNRGVPIEVVQEILGHESIATTRGIYAEVHSATIRAHLLRYRAALRADPPNDAGPGASPGPGSDPAIPTDQEIDRR